MLMTMCLLCIQLSVWSGLPSLIFGVSSIVCSALTLLMPETARCALPDTVEEAELIGRPEPHAAAAGAKAEAGEQLPEPLLQEADDEDVEAKALPP